MSPTPTGGQRDRLQQGLLDQTARITDFQRKLTELSVEATSPDGSVAVTVGGQGQLVGVKFHGDRHRDLSASELGDLVVATAGKAREKALGKVKDLMRGLTGPDLDLSGMLDPGADMTELIGSITDHIESALPTDLRRPR